MRKLTVLLLSLALIFAMAACAGGGTPGTPDGSGDNGTDTTENSGKLIVSGVNTETGSKITAHFMELVEEYSNGTLICESLTDENLVGDYAKLELTMKGDCDIAIGQSTEFASVLNDLYLFELFYLFDNKDEVKNVGFSGETAAQLQAGFEEEGLKCLAMWDNGFHDLALTENSVHTPDDLEGLRIGTAESEAMEYAWKAYSAEPVSTKDADIRESLEEWTIDAQEDNVTELLKASVQDVSGYLVKTGHVYTPLVAVMNLDKFNALSEIQQKAVIDAMAEAQRSSFDECDAYEAYAEKEFAKTNTEIVILTESEISAFKTVISQAECDSYIMDLMTHPDLLDSMVAELEIYRESRTQEEDAQ